MIHDNERKKEEGTKSPLHITDKTIREFPEGEDYNEYCRHVLCDFRLVKEFFPLLDICMLPTLKRKELFIFGWLLPIDLCNIAEKDANIKRFGMYILAHYPCKFPEEGVEVEDICGMINWRLIPGKHRHIKEINGRQTGLCTHHPDGEINDVPIKHRTVKILTSAWKLYYQYKQYLKTGIWDLEDLPHGNDALPILKREGYLSRTGRKV